MAERPWPKAEVRDGKLLVEGERYPFVRGLQRQVWLVVGKLMESKDPNFGFDAQEGEYKDLVKAGIIDPTKVVRTALQDAASVASLLITTEALVAELPKEDTAAPMPAMDF